MFETLFQSKSSFICSSFQFYSRSVGAKTNEERYEVIITWEKEEDLFGGRNDFKFLAMFVNDQQSPNSLPSVLKRKPCYVILELFACGYLILMPVNTSKH